MDRIFKISKKNYNLLNIKQIKNAKIKKFFNLNLQSSLKKKILTIIKKR